MRAFIAIPLPTELQNALRRLQQDLGRELPMTVRWVRPETLHLTLRFLGDIPEDSLEKLRTLVLSVGAGFSPFSVAVGGVGAFPDPHRPRVLWTGLEANPQLHTLAETLENGLQRLGFAAEERPFVPHLTLGRLSGRPRDLTPLLLRHQHFAAGQLPVAQLILFQSQLLPSGARHTPLVSVPLGAAPAKTCKP